MNDADSPLERAGVWALIGYVAALQFSIALAQTLLTLVLVVWLALIIRDRRGFPAPRWFWLLAAYGGATLISTVFSLDPLASLIDDRQLLLFLIVPAVYRLARGSRVHRLLTVMIVAGTASAAVGIVQYGALHYNNLHERADGTVGHYMTYAGLLMLVIGVALARLLFDRRTPDGVGGPRLISRFWPALVLPAMLAALAFTFSRNAWVGAAALTALLLVLKDVRLLWVLPLALVLGLAVAPARITSRFYSIFSLQDPTNLDRLAMLQAGLHMVHDHPWLGVGPNMVERVYPQYREPYAVQENRPHLHNVPMQIAAERGLPALAIWLWFVAAMALDLSRRFLRDRHRVVAAAGLAALIGMLVAGLFEHNFGSSEFLMLFLTIVTLPSAADEPAPRPAADAFSEP